jgi:hypothetical protein
MSDKCKCEDEHPYTECANCLGWFMQDITPAVIVGDLSFCSKSCKTEYFVDSADVFMDNLMNGTIP